MNTRASQFSPIFLCQFFVVVVTAAFALACFAVNASESKVTQTAQPIPLPTKELSEPQCADFLAQLNHKPPSLEFVSCEKTTIHGLRALAAEYRVAGENAARVEAYFVKTSRMPKMRFMCCGWESMPPPNKLATQSLIGVYKKNAIEYAVTMASPETLVNQRKRWHEIPYFQVKIVRYLESP